MLLKIAICDDDVKLCNKIERFIEHYARTVEVIMDIKVFFTGEALLMELHNGEYFDIIFLDIRLTNIDGIEVGHKIRQEIQDNSIQIYYMSSHEPNIKDLFLGRPIDFLPKPLSEKDIWKAIQKSMELLNPKNIFFSYQIQGEHYKVHVKDILYFKAKKKKVEIVTKQRTQEFYATINSIYQELKDYDFVFPDRSYLVNFAHVEHFNVKELKIFEKEDLLPVANHRYGGLVAMKKKYGLKRFVEKEYIIIGTKGISRRGDVE